MSLTDEVYGTKPQKPATLTDETYGTDLEFRQGESEWGRKSRDIASSIYTPVLEMGGMAVGGALGGALGTFGGPVGVAAGGVLGTGVGNVAGARAAHGLDALLGYDKTPSQQPDDARNFALGAGGQILGGALNKGVEALSKVRTPTSMSTRLAGEELSIAGTPKSAEEAASSATRTRRIEAAMLRTGSELPESGVTGNLNLAALEKMRIRDSHGLKAVGPRLETMRETARQKAADTVDRVIPHNPKAADIVRTKIEQFNAHQVPAAANTAPAVQAAETEFAAGIPPRKPLGSGFRSSTESAGEDVFGALKKAESVSKSRFSSTETGYNQPKFTNTGAAPPDNAVTAFLSTEKPPLSFSPASDVEAKLDKILGGLGEKSIDLPAMTYAELREISSAAGAVARRTKNPQPEVSRYFGRLQDTAESEIVNLLKESDPKLVAEYQNLNKLYREQQIGGFRQGEVGAALKQGKEVGSTNLAPERLMKDLETVTNADNVVRALGIKRLSEREGAASMTPATAEEIYNAGRSDATALMKPYFDERIAGLYYAVGGGKKGANAVKNWLSKPATQDVLNKYGLLGEYSPIAQRANALEGRLAKLSETSQEAIRQGRVDLATNALNIKDPDKIYQYIKGSGDTKQAVAEIFRVSGDSTYRAGIKDLIKQGMKEDILRGTNPFAHISVRTVNEKKMQELLPQVFNKAERQTLLDFHSIHEGAAPVSAKGVRHDPISGAVERGIREDVEAVPLGYKGYWAKHGLLTLIDKMGDKYTTAAFSVLDEALVNSTYAKAIRAAFEKGEPNALRRIIQKTYSDDTIKRRILRRIPASGAIAVADEATTDRAGWDVGGNEVSLGRQKTFGGR